MHSADISTASTPRGNPGALFTTFYLCTHRINASEQNRRLSDDFQPSMDSTMSADIWPMIQPEEVVPSGSDRKRVRNACARCRQQKLKVRDLLIRHAPMLIVGDSAINVGLVRCVFTQRLNAGRLHIRSGMRIQMRPGSSLFDG